MKRIQKKHKLKTYLLTGIFVIAPVVITMYLAMELFRLMDGWAKYLIPAKYAPYLPYGIPGLGIILLLLFLILVGVLATNVMGRWLIRLGNHVIENVPVVSSIYSALKKVFETLMGKGGTQAFRKAVLVQYPQKGAWTIAFVTATLPKNLEKKLSRGMMVVYIPTTPNPTSGYMVFVRKKDIKELDMSVEEAFKMVISMGILNTQKE